MLFLDICASKLSCVNTPFSDALNSMTSITAPVENDDNVVKSTSTNGKTTLSAVLHRSLHYEPLHAMFAKGNYLHLSNGQKILDASGGAAVASLGGGSKR